MSASDESIEQIRKGFRDVPDFPKPGILFKDITPVLQDPELFGKTISLFSERYDDQNIRYIAGIDARGFILGAALADRIGAGFLPIRKKGKLPADALAASYELEYGEATIEIHRDALQPGDRVVIIDDLLATGGTASAALHLLRELKADIVEIAFLVELGFLDGRKCLGDTPVFAPIVF